MKIIRWLWMAGVYCIAGAARCGLHAQSLMLMLFFGFLFYFHFPVFNYRWKFIKYAGKRCRWRLRRRHCAPRSTDTFIDDKQKYKNRRHNRDACIRMCELWGRDESILMFFFTTSSANVVEPMLPTAVGRLALDKTEKCTCSFWQTEKQNTEKLCENENERKKTT